MVFEDRAAALRLAGRLLPASGDAVNEACKLDACDGCGDGCGESVSAPARMDGGTGDAESGVADEDEDEDDRDDLSGEAAGEPCSSGVAEIDVAVCGVAARPSKPAALSSSAAAAIALFLRPSEIMPEGALGGGAAARAAAAAIAVCRATVAASTPYAASRRVRALPVSAPRSDWRSR
jgi:hypothetical protein